MIKTNVKASDLVMTPLATSVPTSANRRGQKPFLITRRGAGSQEGHPWLSIRPPRRKIAFTKPTQRG